MPHTIAIDAHAHLRRCFDLSTALDHAASNLGACVDRLGILLLAESSNCHAFEELAERRRSGAWRLAPTAEGHSLRARGPAGSTLILVAGRQVTTRERLEVLSLGSAARLEEGAPVEATLAEARERGGLAVLPWGFGKWWGRRGGIVSRMVAEARPGELFLGDNGNRPRLSPAPALFREAAARGIGVLPGSDPLSFPSQVRNLGGYGFLLPADLDPETPAEGLKRVLRKGSPDLRAIGARESLVRFVVGQVRLRVSP